MVKHKTLTILIMLLLGVGIYLLSTTRKQVIPDKEDLVQGYVSSTDTYESILGEGPVVYLVIVHDDELNNEWSFKVPKQVYVNTRKGDIAIFRRVYMNAELFNVQLALDDGTFISCRNYMPLRDAVTINMD